MKGIKVGLVLVNITALLVVSTQMAFAGSRDQFPDRDGPRPSDGTRDPQALVLPSL